MMHLLAVLVLAAMTFALWQYERARRYEKIGNELKAALEQVTLDRYADAKQYEVLVLDLRGCLARMKRLKAMKHDVAYQKFETLCDDLQALANCFAAVK